MDSLSNCFSRLRKSVCGHNEQRILITGLDAAGKTTILYRLKLNEVVTTIPTIGFNVETVYYKGVSFTCWDVGGKDKIRPLWRHYYQNTSALIFVVDSNDRDRMNEARDELHRFMNEDELLDATLLVFANKQDLPNAMSVTEINDCLGLEGLSRNRKWFLQGATATTGEGLHDGLDWLRVTLGKDLPEGVFSKLSCRCPKAMINPYNVLSSARSLLPNFGSFAFNRDSAEVVALSGKATWKELELQSTIDNELVDTLTRQSYVVVKLDTEEIEQVKRSLAVLKTYMQKKRNQVEPSHAVTTEQYGGMEVCEAHWPSDRSQLRLVEASSEQETGAAASISGHAIALQNARVALAKVAARFCSIEHIESQSAVDAFYYFSRPEDQLALAAHTDACPLTLIVDDAPGLEVFDKGQWLPLVLGQDKVAVMVGRSSSALGIHGPACQHRVYASGTSLFPRTSLSLDLYGSPASVERLEHSSV